MYFLYDLDTATCMFQVTLDGQILTGHRYNEATPSFHQWRDANQIVFGFNFSTKDDAISFSKAINSVLKILLARAKGEPTPFSPVLRCLSSILSPLLASIPLLSPPSCAASLPFSLPYLPLFIFYLSRSPSPILRCLYPFLSPSLSLLLSLCVLSPFFLSLSLSLPLSLSLSNLPPSPSLPNFSASLVCPSLSPSSSFPQSLSYDLIEFITDRPTI